MPDEALSVLLVPSTAAPHAAEWTRLETSRFGPFIVSHAASVAAASDFLGRQAFDGVLLWVNPAEAEALVSWPGLSQATPEAAVVLCLSTPYEPGLALRLLRAGVQDVLCRRSGGPTPDVEELARSMRLAIERKRIDAAARKAYATDLATGLPNRQQLIEHMSQLLALRGREPAPMALLVLRVEGFATVESTLGRESANVLRRKVAVRLRAAVRASDVVAALSNDTFALLLASTEGPLDADRVGLKLLAALHKPFALAGQQVGVAASVGVSRYPADGVDASVLMRQAVAASAAAQALGRGGFVNWRESVGRDTGAANDGVIDVG